MSQCPNYLNDYQEIYEQNPRGAALQWFRDAKYGLFMHYGLYSLLERHEWVMYREKIHVAEYERLKDDFTAEAFDPDQITDLALEAGMKYINITSKHHEGFCLWDSDSNDFNSVNSPAGRDLIGELCEACNKKGLGFFCYYSHGRDWRHPHAPNNDEWGGSARPEYDEPEPVYACGDEHNLDEYVDFVSTQIEELLRNYRPMAGIWLDGIATPLSGDYSKFRCQELYDKIHSLQPQVLVSYKQGLLGTEDFKAPEHDAVETDDTPVEICTTMCPGSWGYMAEKAGEHKDETDVWQTLGKARQDDCNLLLNTGPLPDGAIDPEDATVLREVGGRILKAGFPEKMD
ncbi:MAG: alpha-L-fucosidase [Planctomycetes bacterium]|nr:alpha-L-fucosidase [Planctomycetota bacterium]